MSREISETEISEYERELSDYEEQMKRGWESRPFNEFLGLVTDRLATLEHEKPVCPFCNSKKTSKSGHRTTLIGRGSGPDPNHQWVECICEGCKERWTMEYKGHGDHGYNVWYTKEGKILRGLPTCFEDYRYTCRHCGGDVHRHHYNQDTRQSTDILTYHNGRECFDTYFRCDYCDVEVKCSNGYYCYDSPHRPVKPLDPRKMPIFYEEVGVAVVNDFAVSRIEI